MKFWFLKNENEKQLIFDSSYLLFEVVLFQPLSLNVKVDFWRNERNRFVQYRLARTEIDQSTKHSFPPKGNVMTLFGGSFYYILSFSFPRSFNYTPSHPAPPLLGTCLWTVVIEEPVDFQSNSLIHSTNHLRIPRNAISVAQITSSSCCRNISLKELKGL